MGAEFWGAGDGSFFDYAEISKNRHIKYPMLPSAMASMLGNNALIRIQPKQRGEIRILSADIALMSSKKHDNDATAIFINQMLMTKSGRYSNNIIYTESNEGLRTDDQALIIRRLFDEYQCDYMVLDTNGLGIGIFDAIAKDIVDPETGEIYPALSCCNNKTMEMRCTVPGAPKVIFSVKAGTQFNSDCAFLLREGFKSGQIRLLVTEYDGDQLLQEIKGYSSLSPVDRLKLQSCYINTTLLIDELVKLRHEEIGNQVRMIERSGSRKDRYSSLSYNYYIATQLGAKQMRRNNQVTDSDTFFAIRAPKYSTSRGGMKANEFDYRRPSWAR